MCMYAQEVKDCLTRLTDGERPFSAWNVTQAVRSVVGADTNVSHEEVKGMVHVLMEQNENFYGRFNGQFVEYVPLLESPEDEPAVGRPASEEQVRLDMAEAIRQTGLDVAKTEPGAKGSFLDRTHLVFRGEAVTLRFDLPITVIELRAG